MGTSMIPAIIAGALAIVAVILTNYYTRKREREADWRKIKLEYYKEFMAALAGSVQGRAAREDVIKYHDALNTIGLVAPPVVLEALNAFVDHNSIRNTNQNLTRHDELLSVLMNAMRDDISPNGVMRGQHLEFRLIAPPPDGAATLPRTIERVLDPCPVAPT